MSENLEENYFLLSGITINLLIVALFQPVLASNLAASLNESTSVHNSANRQSVLNDGLLPAPVSNARGKAVNQHAISLPEPTLSPTETQAAVQELQAKHLLLPIHGVYPDSLKGSFCARRGTEMHRAVDILAARNTPVLAADNGCIAKLFLSKPGGNTIYEYDSSGKYIYYYAHLERYATGIRAGDSIARGQVIGFVGTSGNAPKNTPHLHFAIYKTTEKDIGGTAHQLILGQCTHVIDRQTIYDIAVGANVDRIPAIFTVG